MNFRIFLNSHQKNNSHNTSNCKKYKTSIFEISFSEIHHMRTVFSPHISDDSEYAIPDSCPSYRRKSKVSGRHEKYSCWKRYEVADDRNKTTEKGIENAIFEKEFFSPLIFCIRNTKIFSKF